MSKRPEREYASQADYAEWVRDAAKGRLSDVVGSLRRAFGDVIRREEVEVIVFSGLTASELAERICEYPVITKPLLLATNIAARAIEREL